MGHYLAARDWDLAAELLACHSIRFVQSGALGGRAREWLAQFPAAVVGDDARLCYVSALLAALSGDRDRRDGWLATGERAGWEGPMPDGTASYALAALSLEAMLCFGDLSGAVRAAERALAALPRGAPVRAAVEALTAWHLYLLGRDPEAEQLARQAVGEQVHLPSAGLPLVAYLPRAVLALVTLRRGDVAEARLLTAAARRRARRRAAARLAPRAAGGLRARPAADAHRRPGAGGGALPRWAGPRARLARLVAGRARGRAGAGARARGARRHGAGSRTRSPPPASNSTAPTIPGCSPRRWTRSSPTPRRPIAARSSSAPRRCSARARPRSSPRSHAPAACARSPTSCSSHATPSRPTPGRCTRSWASPLARTPCIVAARSDC